MKTSRRDFIARSGLVIAGVATGWNAAGQPADVKSSPGGKTNDRGAQDGEAFRISLFSKHLQWLGYEEMASVAAEMGFDGVDLTVRPHGHVLPENVETDLPKAMEAVKKAGMNIYMIVTSITEAADPVTDKILKTASSLGIRHYRTGWLYYDKNLPVQENMNKAREKLSRLAELNEKYFISGEYQNHSGVYGEGIHFGAAIWDLAEVLKDINSPWVGSQYDIYHAMIEGASTWPVPLELIRPYIRSLDIKDFSWIEKEGKAITESVPLGKGMVDFKQYFNLLKGYNLAVPVSLHCEYPLGGAESGAGTLTIPGEEVISAIKKDLTILKTYLQEAGLV
jgi:sugar phosphate isomerase/epimerase